MSPAIRRTAIALVSLCGLGVMHSFASLRACTAVFYLALAAVLAGAVSIAVPLRFLDIGSRKAGAVVLAAGVAAAAVALIWPASKTQRAGGQSKMDEYLPAYEFGEFHTALVEASPGLVYRAARETTFGDLRVCAFLMRLRRAAEGHLKPMDPPGTPMLEMMTRPGAGFVVLADDGAREIVPGLAGRPWHFQYASMISSRDDYLSFDRPGSVKVAMNIRIEDAGGGWSRIATETRVAGTDDSGSRKMAPYWRVIYPGSGLIRRMWLRAIRSRAESLARIAPARRRANP